jgi:hypothetical protein
VADASASTISCAAWTQAATDETIQRRRDPAGERRRIVVEDRVSGLDGGVALERAATREHLVDDGPESKDVRALIRRLAPHLLGRHVADRAEDRAVLGVRLRRGQRLASSQCHRRHQLGDAEVEDLQPTLLGDEEVLGLEVAVDDALLMRSREALRELKRAAARLLHRQSSFPQTLAQRAPVQQLGDDVRVALVRPDVVHVKDVGVIERAGSARFLLEPAQRFLSVQSRSEHFDGDVAAELAVVGDEDPPHSASADLFLDAVALVNPGRVRDVACWDRRSHLLGLAHATPAPRCPLWGFASSGAIRRDHLRGPGSANLKVVRMVVAACERVSVFTVVPTQKSVRPDE